MSQAQRLIAQQFLLFTRISFRTAGVGLTTAGQRIKTARKAKGWSQEQLAVYADVASKTVWSAEKGEDVSDKTLRRLGTALGIDFFAEEVAS